MKLNAVLIAVTIALTGCASVPMAPKEQDAAAKTFSAPQDEKSALYVFRNSFVGQALRKLVSVDGVPLGQSANQVYFYKEIAPGNHTVTTESEFGDNSLFIKTEQGKSYFVRQYIKMGVFVGGSDVELVSEEEGRKEVMQCEMAKPIEVSASK